MKTSEVLEKAAQLIEERGWTTGPSGWGAPEWTDNPSSGPLCLEGAILAATGYDYEDSDQWHEFKTCPAYVAVQEYLNTRADLWEWNDQVANFDTFDTLGGERDRTPEQVTAVLRGAADVARIAEHL